MDRVKRLFAGFISTLPRMLCVLFLHVGIVFIFLAALLHRRVGFRQWAATAVAGWPVLGSAVNTADHAVQAAAQIHDDTTLRWVALSAQLIDEGDLQAAATAAYVVGRYGAALPAVVAAHVSLKAAFERGIADANQEATERAPMVR